MKETMQNNSCPQIPWSFGGRLDGNLSEESSIIPELSPCFHNTLILYIPFLFMMIAFPLELYKLIAYYSFKCYLLRTTISRLKFICEICVLLLTALSHHITASSKFIEIKRSGQLRILLTIIAMILHLFHDAARCDYSTSLVLYWLLHSSYLVIIETAQLFNFDRKYYDDPTADIENQVATAITIAFSTFLMCLYASKDIEFNPVHIPSPFERATFFSRLFFWWMQPLIIRGFTKPLEESDLPLPLEDIKAESCHQAFEKVWDAEQAKLLIARRKWSANDEKLLADSELFFHGPYQLLKALASAFRISEFYIFVLELCHSALQFGPVFLLDLVIEFMKTDKQPKYRGYLLALTLLAANVASNAVASQMQYFNNVFMLQIKSALCTALYFKVMVMSASSRNRFTTGELVNMMSVDVDKIAQLCLYAGEIWGAPLRLVVAIILVYQYLGPASLAAIGVICFVMLCSVILANYAQKIQLRQMELKDERLKLTTELLNGMKLLKLYAWEEPFAAQILERRAEEISKCRKFVYINAAVNFAWNCLPVTLGLVSFVAYILVDSTNVLDARKIFVTLALYNTLRFSLLVIPDIVAESILAKVSVVRLARFLQSEEIPSDATGLEPDGNELLTMENASFSWEQSKPETLDHIDLHIQRGEIVALVGFVGAGKSSLGNAIVGEMYKKHGRIDRVKRLAYVSQSAFIQNATVRQNIIFTRKFHQTLYDQVVDACCLQPDLKLLQKGDMTVVGQKGQNLSGGQKQRIALARAVYQNMDLYILDDPLSAVDAPVAKALFGNVIGPHGLLKKKGRILITHHNSILRHVDRVLLMENGTIVEQGVYKELIQSNSKLATFLQYPKNEADAQLLSARGGDVDLKDSSISHEYGSVRTTHKVHNHFFKQAHRLSDAEKTSDERTTEEMAKGKIAKVVYKNYLQVFGIAMSVVVVTGYIACRSFDVAANMWLANWSDDPVNEDGTQPGRTRRILVYTVFGVSQGIAVFVSSLILGLRSLQASETFHKLMIERIIRVPMSFFDVTPIGRIINRFGKDIDYIDFNLPVNMDSWLEFIVEVLAVIILISTEIPLFAICALILLGFYYIIQNYHLRSSRQLKRIESITRSPLYNFFAETIHGVVTVRAFNAQPSFITRFKGLLDSTQNAMFCTNVAQRWLMLRLDLIGSIIVFSTALLLVTYRETINDGTAGLSLLYALKMTEALNMLLRFNAELENTLVSVERINEYTNLTKEASWTSIAGPPVDWPASGEIHLDNITCSYRGGLSNVLKGITLKIDAGEKVAIVGRTGAGKSTLTLVLFRIIEPSKGRITIDNIDISTIGLHELRSKLTIIPQDPVLFTGTVKMNLDPFNEHDEVQIWKALEKSNLKTFIENFDAKLQHKVQDSGQNFSLGQHQLICLARALLRQSKILVLDEATAAMDAQTDALLQNTLRTDFAECTMIIVAHRLQTILNADRVVVISAGEIKEVGTPTDLMANPESTFYSMAKEAGIIKDKSETLSASSEKVDEDQPNTLQK